MLPVATSRYALDREIPTNRPNSATLNSSLPSNSGSISRPLDIVVSSILVLPFVIPIRLFHLFHYTSFLLQTIISRILVSVKFCDIMGPFHAQTCNMRGNFGPSSPPNLLQKMWKTPKLIGQFAPNPLTSGNCCAIITVDYTKGPPRMTTCGNATCTNQFTPKSFIHRFCSSRCRRLARGDAWGWVRAEALDRDQHQCQVCCSTASLQVHHVLPVCMGGESELENVTTLCALCHREVHRSWARYRGVETLERRANASSTNTRGAKSDRAA